MMLLALVAIGGTLTITADANSPSIKNFTKQATYQVGRFTDVDQSAWYANSVALAYEYGLMSGTSATTFNASSNITIAEVITLAARIDSIFYTGAANFAPSAVWYQTYVDYAIDAGIINAGEYSNYTALANRAQFADILASALPSYALNEKNWVDDNAIPDVKITDNYADAIYKLYRAGIVTGTDSQGSFSPSRSILRAEVATIVTRMVDESLRGAITLTGEY